MSKYINLIDKLTERDKKMITEYIAKYGCNIKDFIGLDAWLETWSHANQKLYHLLGDSLVKEFPYSYNKPTSTLFKEFRELLFNANIKDDYHEFYKTYIKTCDYMTPEQVAFFNHLFDTDNFIEDKIFYSIKIKKPGADKMLQIQEGTKPIKAIGRVLNYFKDEIKYKESDFEAFKKEYAIILSEKVLKGTLCVSIHPMDYMTMSDNESNWTSCMSWKNQGCYHEGTIEMMNSNNVLCAYFLIGENKYFFNKDLIDKETGEIIGYWNNKKWRQLIYITKDIVMGGKAYPYQSKDMTIAILNEVRNLAKDNLNWGYTFGPELYRDMLHINNARKVEKQREWMHSKEKKIIKHNILWDTKGMYNDMLNDRETEYWCFRNKVNSTKIISVSGKAPCLCCGGSIIEQSDDDYEYNDRYSNTESAVCKDCVDNLYTCYHCDGVYYQEPLYILKDGKRICKSCIDAIRICPCCGKEFFITDWNAEIGGEIFYNNFLYEDLEKGIELPTFKYPWILRASNHHSNDSDNIAELAEYRMTDDPENADIGLEKLYACPSCANREAKNIVSNNLHYISILRTWSYRADSYSIVDPAIAEPFRVRNLIKPETPEILLDSVSET